MSTYINRVQPLLKENKALKDEILYHKKEYRELEIVTHKLKDKLAKIGDLKFLDLDKVFAEVNQRKDASNIQLKWLINERKLDLNAPKATIDISKAGAFKIEVLAIKEGDIIDRQIVE